MKTGHATARWARFLAVSVFSVGALAGLTTSASASPVLSHTATVPTVTTIEVPATLDCAAMSGSVLTYAVDHGYCKTAAGGTGGVAPDNTVPGNCGDSFVEIANKGGGVAYIEWGFNSTDGAADLRDLTVSWVNWTTEASSIWTDNDEMLSANYKDDATVKPGAGEVYAYLGGSITLVWGGICDIADPVSSANVT